jgi:hypothetical protein
MIRALALATTLLALAAGAPPAAVAAAQPPMTDDGLLMLRMGDQAVVSFDAGMQMVLKKFDHVGPDGPSVAPAAGPDEVVLYIGKKDGGTFMTVRNGTGAALHYKALLVMVQDGKLQTAPTSICPIAPHAFGLENWPEALAGLVVGPFQKVDPKQAACTE